MNDAPPSRTAFDDLRVQILDHINAGTPFKRPRVMRLSLDALRHVEWELEWLETAILFNCYQRTIPARTHGNLGRLRKKRVKRGEQAAFDSFMAQVKAILHPEFITPHGYNATFAELDAHRIFASMAGVFAPLTELGCPMFLYAGALLGYVRSGKLIEHDDDIDIAICLGECTNADAPKRWLTYKKKLDQAGLLTPASAVENSISFKLKTSLPIDVDLFPAWTNDGQFSVYPYSFGELGTEAIFPLKSFEKDPLMFPAKAELLLEQSYGKNWRVPDPLFHLNWIKKKRLFHQLVSQDYVIE